MILLIAPTQIKKTTPHLKTNNPQTPQNTPHKTKTLNNKHPRHVQNPGRYIVMLTVFSRYFSRPLNVLQALRQKETRKEELKEQIIGNRLLRLETVYPHKLNWPQEKIRWQGYKIRLKIRWREKYINLQIHSHAALCWRFDRARRALYCFSSTKIMFTLGSRVLRLEILHFLASRPSSLGKMYLYRPVGISSHLKASGFQLCSTGSA